MLKKIILSFSLVYLLFIGNNVFAGDPQAGGTALENLQKEGFGNGKGFDDGKTIDGKAPTGTTSNTSGNGGTAQRDTSQDITKETFTIDTDTFSVGGKNLKGITGKETINKTLGTFIRKLMIALGVISLLIMTIGAGYIILYHGEDEYLSKGKSIFKAGIIALVVSLSSYYIVNLVGYILYK